LRIAKLQMSFKRAQELVEHKLHTCGAENILATGAKLKYIGGGWWYICGYHYAGKDVTPYL
jgi:hypothetical protein